MGLEVRVINLFSVHFCAHNTPFFEICETSVKVEHSQQFFSWIRPFQIDAEISVVISHAYKKKYLVLFRIQVLYFSRIILYL